MEWNDRRDGSGLRFFDAKPYFPQRGADKGPSMGVQGKLFPDPKPVDSVRYPRGYTPERMRELADARIDVQHNPKEDGAFSGPAGPRRIREVLARSTTPAHEFVQPYYKGDEPDDMYSLKIKPGGDTSYGRGYAAAGTYSGWSHYNRGEIALASNSVSPGLHGAAQARRMGEEQAGQTLLHELGHYRSAVIEKNPSRSYSTPTERGKEEAFADDNEQERWRPDPRDVRHGLSRPARASYESESAHQGLGGKKSFLPYLRARKTPLKTVDRKGNYIPQNGGITQPQIPAPLNPNQLSPAKTRMWWDS